MDNTQRVTIAHVNINSLRNKVDDVHRLLFKNKIEILSVNETHLDSTITDSLLRIPGYAMIRYDRNAHGGGVCFYVHSKLNYSVLDCCRGKTESLFISIDLKHPRRKLVLGTVYRPPNSLVEYWDDLSTAVDGILRIYNSMVLLGDLNVNVLGSHTNGHLTQFCSEFHLQNIIHVPTRFPSNSCLDLALISGDILTTSPVVIPSSSPERE